MLASMAANITKTNNIMKHTEAVTKSSMDQQQIQQTLQSMLLGSLSSYFYARGFFCDEAYETQCFQLSSEFQSYERFAGGKISFDTNAPPEVGVGLPVLRRNRSKKVDSVFKLLENGVFTALKEGTVKTLNVYVHPVKDRNKVLETYIMTFEDLTAEDGSGRVNPTIEVEAPHNHRTTFKSANAQLIYVFGHLEKIATNLPHLREEAREESQGERSEMFITMELCYKSGTRKKAHPSGFVGKTGGPKFIAEAEGWERRAEEISNLRFGTLGVGLRLDYLQDKDISFKYSILDPREPSFLPDQLTFPEPRDAFETLTKVRSWNVRSTTSSVSQKEKASDDTRTTLYNVGDREGDTQMSNGSSMGKLHRKMMQPEHMTQGDTQTQFLTSQALSQRVPASPMNFGADKHHKSDVVLCECGSTTFDDVMVRCHGCKTLQHRHCYGYTSSIDDRLPFNYNCYRCLLDNDEQDIIQELSALVFKRRAMFLADKYGLTTQDAFVASMRSKSSDGTTSGPKTTVARSIHQYLRKQGYVVQAGKGRMVAVKSGPRFEAMLKDLFDPLKKINHHYDLPEVRKPGSMPPPETPARPSQRNPTTTPRTDLDRSVTAPHNPTPTRPATFQRQISKRDREENTTVEYAPKRHASLRIIHGDSPSQSASMLNVSQVLSSPTTVQTSDDL